MSLRSKTGLLLGVVLALMVSTTYVVQQHVVLPGFIEAERTEAKNDLGRCVDAIKRDVEHLAMFTRDWSAWDDSYAFIVDGNQAYITANLAPTTMTNNRLNLMVFARPDGAMVWGRLFDLNEGKAIENPELLKHICDPANGLVTRRAAGEHLSGLLMTHMGPMLLTSQAIVKTDNQGPVRGALVMGRLLDEAAVTELAARTRVAVRLERISDQGMAPDAREAVSHLWTPESIWLREKDARQLQGYTLLRDIGGKPVLLMRADLPRTISRRGVTAARVAMWSHLASGAAILALVWFMLQYMVATPLMTLTQHAVRVGREKDLRARLNLARRDEIGVLACEFDRMVTSLGEYRAQLLGMARQAGMAEVATGVLHNVGNVLNSVTTSADVVTEKLQHSEIPSLGLAADLLAKHREDLATFLTQDEQGRQVPEFLRELSTFLSREQEAMLEEMKTLHASLAHIRQVVEMQQDLAGQKPVLETVDPVKLVEEALRMIAESFERHHIHVERHFGPVSAASLERHRMVEILVNLLSNAKDALRKVDPADRRLTVAVEMLSGGEANRLRIVITDNGVGIAAENLSKIFAFGFTTRAEGHGFGLHAAANAARQMGGSLTALSEGEGKGASFILEVPITCAQSTP
jgi:two-component system, NtrC family, sensor kinase